MSNLRLPRLVEVNDYHEFDNVQHVLRTLTGTNEVKVKEIGFNGFYVGVVYTGVKPDRNVILNLAEMQDISLRPCGE